MTIRTAGLAAGVTLAVTAGTLHGLAALTLTTRPRLERWLANRAAGTGLYPADWHWPGMPR